ncbi:MAG: hypothetical protein DI556_22160 [Rhodovulum sulfidophilum]|uniref:TRAP transporter small permease protein n=1 Tax=Rhodovulum sulfidophilum TaxID=35806 RepID=A0A2W5PTG5_RHOSU|nr:MAG: hypothetical protein DI556_22160 [Rhodovulum sulfidophilum]
MTSIEKAIALPQRAVLLMAAAALSALPLITTYDVMMRYVFHAPTIWATEISIYLLQFVVFLTPGALLADGRHLRVTFWIESLTGRSRRVAERVAALAVVPYAAVLVWYGATYAIRAYERGMVSPTLLQVPLWLVYALVPLGGVLLLLGVVLRCLSVGSPETKEGAAA